MTVFMTVYSTYAPQGGVDAKAVDLERLHAPHCAVGAIGHGHDIGDRALRPEGLIRLDHVLQ